MSAQPEPQLPEPITTGDVVFAEATPRQRLLSWQLNGASWAPPMTIEQYVGRETTLSQTALSANGGTRYMVLHPKDDPDTIVSACEITAKRALVAGGGAHAGVREVDAYSIASVFTNPRFRERGMASHMLRKVQEQVDGGGAEFGALYSDIGRVYYTRLGWKDFRSPQVLFTLVGGPALQIPALGTDRIALLREEDVAAVCERDVAAVREQFSRIDQGSDGSDGSDGKTHVAFLPTFEQLSWHFARDRYVCGVLRGREVVHRGARTADGAGWVLWDHDLREKKLKVLRLVTRAGEGDADQRRADVRTLLLAALAEARDWDLPKVLVWNPSEEVGAVATGLWRELGPGLQVVFEEREDGSIPSLRWKGGKGLENVVWEHDEYFAWC